MKDEIAQKLLDYLDATKDLVLEQAPDIFQQIIRYETISTIYGIVIFSTILLGIICASIYMYRNPSGDKYSGYNLTRCMIPIIFIPIFFIQLLFSVDALIKIKVAPKYYIIQKLKG